MTAGLLQRTRVLQEENDELYGLLRSSETGKLKEETRCLKKVITRMERALAGVYIALRSFPIPTEIIIINLDFFPQIQIWLSQR